MYLLLLKNYHHTSYYYHNMYINILLSLLPYKHVCIYIFVSNNNNLIYIFVSNNNNFNNIKKNGDIKRIYNS